MTNEAGSIGEPLVGHVRQPFFELYQAQRSDAIEEEIRGHSAEQRRAVRVSQQVAIMPPFGCVAIQNSTIGSGPITASVCPANLRPFISYRPSEPHLREPLSAARADVTPR